MSDGIISSWLYKGAPPGTKQAIQNQVKDLGWRQIGKNILNDPEGFSSSYKGPGATNKPNYYLQGVKSMIPGLKAQGNIGGGTTPSRQAFEKLMASPTFNKAVDFGKKGINLTSKFLSKASLPLSILAPTRLGSAELNEQDLAKLAEENNITIGGGGGSKGIMNPELLNQFDNITNTGVNQRPRLTDRIKGGIETLKDKLGPIGDFFSKGGAMGNVISALGKRGDESTRGIAGLNLQDVFNIETAERIAKELELDSGEDPAKDPYGINIVSGFGNYNQYVKDKAKQLSLMKFKTDSGKRRKDFYEQAAAQIKAQEEKALADALARAQEEINRMGYQDYGSGGADTFDTTNIDDAGNYQDDLDPGQTE